MSESMGDLGSSQPTVSRDKWTQRDTGWMLNLFGTAIGAGCCICLSVQGQGGYGL